MSGRGGKVPGSGRKKGATNLAKRTIAEMLMPMVPEVIRALTHDLRLEPCTARTAAINTILAYVYGKPVQGVVLTGVNGGPVQIEQQVAARDAFIRRIAEANPGAGEDENPRVVN